MPFDKFTFSHHLPTGQCMDIVRRSYMLITRSWGCAGLELIKPLVKGLLSFTI